MQRAARAGNPDDPEPDQKLLKSLESTAKADQKSANAASAANPPQPAAPTSPSPGSTVQLNPVPPAAPQQPTNPAAVSPSPAVPSPATPMQPVAAPAQPANVPPDLVQDAPPPNPLSPDERRARTIQNMTAIAMALEGYMQGANAVPEQAFTDETTLAPLLSWRVALLPQLGHAKLYRQFKLDQRWDSPHNLQLLKQIPPEFQSPERFDDKTNYLFLQGDAVAMASTGNRSFTQFKDGMANTVLVVEVDDKHAVPWTKPGDFDVNLATPQAGIGTLRQDGFFAILANSTLVKVPATTPADHVKALFTFAGGDGPKAIDIVKDPGWKGGAAVAANVPGPTIEPGATTPAPMTPVNPPVGENPTATPADQAIDLAAITEQVLPGGPPRSDRAPLPSEAEAKAARELLREVYAKDYAAAQRPEEKQKLAAQMMADAATIQQKSEQHEMLRIARDVAVQLGDLDLALKSVDALSQQFEIDALALRAKTLSDVQSSGRFPKVDMLGAEARKLLQDALQQGHFEAAQTAQEIVLAVARSQQDKPLIAQALAIKEKIEADKQAYAEVPAALSSLTQNMNDAAACETVGKYLCLYRHQWDLGLPLLAKGENLKLRFVASIDLETNKSSKTLVQLGDQYWELASEFRGPAKWALQARGASWYAQALPQLAGSLERIKVQKRVDELVSQLGKQQIDELAGEKVSAGAVGTAATTTTGRPDPNAQFQE